MDLINQHILIGALLLLLGVLATAMSQRLGMPLLLAFLSVGMLAGEDGPGGIVFKDIELAYLIGSVALAVILFDGGMNTHSAKLRFSLRPALMLATVGVVITSAITGFFAAWSLDMPWLNGMLIGATVGSTDAAAVFALLRARGIALEQRVAASLEIESSSNDPMAIFLTVALVQILVQDSQASATQLLGLFLTQMGIGTAAGLAGGKLLVWLINRVHLERGLYHLLTLAGAGSVFAVATVFGGSGFLAIYLVGVVLGNSRLQEARNILHVHDGMTWLAQSVMFLMLGLLAAPRALLPHAVASLSIAAALMALARPAAVAICLLPFRFSWREQLFIGWVGLRGAVPVILALFPLFANLPDAIIYLDVAFFVVIVSLLVQGWTIAPLARLLRLEVPPAPEPDQYTSINAPGSGKFVLFGYQLSATSRAIGRSPAELPLPPETQLVSVIRQDHLLTPPRVEALRAGDFVCLLGESNALESNNELFAVAAAPKRLERQVFFGYFVLDGSVPVTEIAAAYGVIIPDAKAEQPLGEYLANFFNNDPVVGDRVRAGGIELVVKEIKDGHITQVGLKLPTPD
jgi:cell volume regulation protein A